MTIIRPQLDQVRIEKDGRLPFALIDAIRKVYDYLAASVNVATNNIEVIQDTHANRQILHPPADSPLGSLYFETDRAVIYICRTTLFAHAWVYVAGVMSGLVAARPADLTTTDVGFLYTSTNSLDYRWSGAAWVTLGTVKGGANLTNVGKITKVSAAGTITESSLTDNATIVSGTEPLYLNVGASPGASQIQLQANALGGLELLSFAADNCRVGFDVIRSGGVNVAKDVSASLLLKNGAQLTVYGAVGLTVGNAAALNLLFTIDLATGNVDAVTGVYKKGGAAGITGVAALAPLTGGGTPGTLTYAGGIITAYVAPT